MAGLVIDIYIGFRYPLAGARLAKDPEFQLADCDRYGSTLSL